MSANSLIFVLAISAVSAFAFPGDPWERAKIAHIAGEYQLNREQSKLLLAIRLVERGGPGLYFGVAQNYPFHPARRHASNPARSFEIQCRWAARIIAKHYHGRQDLESFGRRYCENPRWAKMVASKLRRMKA